MYYYIKGRLLHFENDIAVIDCGGVGYMMSISKTTYNRIAELSVFNADGSLNGTEILLYTHLNVREDAMELFGFFSEEERTIFRQLTSVSGIGPKAALAILSALTVSSFLSAVFSDNAKAIAAAQGVGLKTAQKVILELKDKLMKLNIPAEITDDKTISSLETESEMQSEARDALIVLGYSKNEATRAIKAASGKNSEELIRNALRILMKP